MRLSNFAQDALLSVIYRLEEIEEVDTTTLEQEILATAHKYDRNREHDEEEEV